MARALWGSLGLLLDGTSRKVEARYRFGPESLRTPGRGVRQDGIAAIVTTHDPRLHEIADRVLTLREGTLHA